MVTREVVSITTNADGDGTGYTSPVSGIVRAIRYVKVDYANGVDVTITSHVSGQAILAWTDVNASETSYPKAPANSLADVALVFAAGGEPVPADIPVASEPIKIVVAQGGDTKSGTFHVYVES